MTMTMCDKVKDLLPGYALGALDDPEVGVIERHLRLCMPCQIAARADRAVVEQLGFAAPLHQPPPEMKACLMSRVAREPRTYTALFPARPRIRLRGIPRWLVAAAVLPWLAVMALSAHLFMSLQNTPAHALKVMNVVGSRGETGHLAMITGETTAFLMLTHMPALRAGRWFTCWLERNGKMEYVNNFGLLPHSDEASFVLHAPRPLESYSRLAITIEVSAHPIHPTGAILASGKM